MSYTIRQAAEMTHLTVHAIRYYDKEGMLPFVERTQGGIRKFEQKDLEWLSLICCLKHTGMPVKQIKEYIALCVAGDSSVEERRELLLRHRENMLEQMAELQRNLSTVDYKIAHYTQIGANLSRQREGETT